MPLGQQHIQPESNHCSATPRRCHHSCNTASTHRGWFRPCRQTASKVVWAATYPVAVVRGQSARSGYGSDALARRRCIHSSVRPETHRHHSTNVCGYDGHYQADLDKDVPTGGSCEMALLSSSNSATPSSSISRGSQHHPPRGQTRSSLRRTNRLENRSPRHPATVFFFFIFFF